MTPGEVYEQTGLPLRLLRQSPRHTCRRPIGERRREPTRRRLPSLVLTRQRMRHWRADSRENLLVDCQIMAKSTQPASPPEEALDQLLDIVSNAREELVAVERRLEQLRADIAKSQKQRDGSSRKRRNLILKPAPSTPAAGQKKDKENQLTEDFLRSYSQINSHYLLS